MQILCGEIQQISQGVGNVRKLNRIILVPVYLLSITVNSCQFVSSWCFLITPRHGYIINNQPTLRDSWCMLMPPVEDFVQFSLWLKHSKLHRVLKLCMSNRICREEEEARRGGSKVYAVAGQVGRHFSSYVLCMLPSLKELGRKWLQWLQSLCLLSMASLTSIESTPARPCPSQAWGAARGGSRGTRCSISAVEWIYSDAVAGPHCWKSKTASTSKWNKWNSPSGRCKDRTSEHPCSSPPLPALQLRTTAISNTNLWFVNGGRRLISQLQRLLADDFTRHGADCLLAHFASGQMRIYENKSSPLWKPSAHFASFWTSVPRISKTWRRWKYVEILHASTSADEVCEQLLRERAEERGCHSDLHRTIRWTIHAQAHPIAALDSLW